MTLKYLIIIYVSLILHELGHFFVAIIIRAKILKFRITLFGVNMQIVTNELSFNRKLALFYSGPIANITIVLFAYMYKFNDILKVNIFLSLINLLPIVPLDGGNVLKAFLDKYIKRQYVYPLILTMNIIFLLISAYCFYISHSIVYLAILLMAIRGIIYEKRNILEEKIKNNYKKFI